MICASARHAPQDAELRAIATTLDELQQRYGNTVWAQVKRVGHYSHSVKIECGAEADDGSGDGIDLLKADEEMLCEAFHDFMHWMYCVLKAEHDYLMSDEVVDEMIVANEDEFDADGTRA